MIKMYKIMFICLFLFLSCANGVKNEKANNIEQEDSLLESKADIIETVVSLPYVTKHSGIKVKDDKDVKYFIFEDEISKSGHEKISLESGYELLVLDFKEKDSISKYRCFHFDEIDVKKESAFVRMFYPNGLIAVGNLNLVNGKWSPSDDFKVGFR